MFYHHTGSHIVIRNDTEYVGNGEQFAKYILNRFAYMDNSMSIEYSRMAEGAFDKMINQNKTRAFARMDFMSAGYANPVQVRFELFKDIAPRTVANFLSLCNGFKRSDGESICYVGTEVHRIVKGLYLQMGKINPTKKPELGMSIYGPSFEDESFSVKHTEIGLLGMCKKNNASHSNECQFYITLGAPLTFLDNEYVIFGRVISGMRALRAFENMETTNEKPNDSIKVVNAKNGN